VNRANDLRVGLVGAGGWGARYAEKIACTDGARLSVVIDRDTDRAAAAAQRGTDAAPHSARPMIATHAQALLGQVDAAVVAVPAREHANVARVLLEHGIAVLLEKPLASTLAEADGLVEIARARGALLQPAHLERFNPGVAALQEHIRRPRFVEANRLGPFPGRGTDVDVVLDLMIHDLDLVLEFVEEPIDRVSARGVPVLTDEVDIANARIEFAGGCVADLTASRVSLKRERKMRIFQESAYLALDFAEPSLVTVRREPPATPGIPPEIRVEPVVIEPRDALATQVASFVAAVRAGKPAVSVDKGRRALEVALRIGEDIARWR
jgi:predicted dehydrogenase